MFFTLYEMRQNRESERRWQARFEQIQKDRQAAREEHQAWVAEHQAWMAEQRAWRDEERQQQIITLLAQNQQLMGMLLDLLERRSDSAGGASD